MRKGFENLLSGLVKPAWIDQNGHMNVVFYMRIFDKGMDRMLRLIGFSDELVKKERYTIVASRINIIHRKELLRDEPWQLDGGLLTVNSRYLTFVHRLSSKNTVRAYCYIRGVVFCTSHRASRVLDDYVLDKAKQFVVAGLIDPFEMPRS